MIVPEEIVIVLSGIPATRKSTFGKYLAREHGFAHYDLECHPRGWPRPELKPVWEADRRAFVIRVRKVHRRVALDWGFPPSLRSWVRELQDQGVRLIWFDGDVGRAREAFIRRGGIEVARFDTQVKLIQTADYPRNLECLVIPALSASGIFLIKKRIANILFDNTRGGCV